MSTKTNEIKKLIKIIEETSVPITEIEIVDQEGSKIRLCCSNPQTNISALSGPTLTTAVLNPTYPPITTTTPNPLPLTQTSPAHDSPDPDPTQLGTTINAPMVGTVYLAPSPDAEKFVQVGQTIKMGCTVCLIEAMKMFNKIESEINGTLIKCLIEDGQPVEFGQPLFIVKTDDK